MTSGLKCDLKMELAEVTNLMCIDAMRAIECGVSPDKALEIVCKKVMEAKCLLKK